MSELKTKVIVNPVAGANSTRHKWPLISRILEHIGLLFDAQYTEGVGHAIEIAREAASNGYRNLVAVGGDGTVNEVANGILYSTHASETTLGIITTGTGSDFVRSIGIPRDYASACSTLTSSKRLAIDVGVVEYSKNGQTRERFFINAAGAGFDAEVVRQVERMPKNLGGTIPYLTGVARTLFGYKNKDVELSTGGEVSGVRILNVVVANGAYIGGGMHIAPKADLGDSLLDVVVMGDFGKFEVIKEFPTVYKGTHIYHPKVSMKKASSVAIKSRQPVLVYADGELLGECPASFRIMPAALRIVV